MSAHQNTIALGGQASRVYCDLKRQLDQGLLVAGQRLPTQRQLSGRYKTSVTTVNKAILRLQDEKRVWTRTGAGVFVSERPATAPVSRIISCMYQHDGECLHLLQSAALEHGYLFSIYLQSPHGWRPQAERVFLTQVREQHHQALLAFCSPMIPRNEDLLRELETAGVRVLHIEHYREDLPDQPYLLPDFERAGHAAVIKLLLARYDNIAVLCQEPPSLQHAPFARLVLRGAMAAMTEHGNPGWNADAAHLAYPTHVDHERRLREVLANVPSNTGILALVSGHGRDAARVLRELGRDVPGDIGVIGIDVSDSTFVFPCDEMNFCRERFLQRAVDVVTAPIWTSPRELVAPVWLQQGTIR